MKGGAHVNVVNQRMESPLHVALQELIRNQERTINDFERVKIILQILLKDIGQSSQDCNEFLGWKDTKGKYIVVKQTQYKYSDIFYLFLESNY